MFQASIRGAVDGQRCPLAVFRQQDMAAGLAFANPTGAQEGFHRLFAGDLASVPM